MTPTATVSAATVTPTPSLGPPPSLGNVNCDDKIDGSDVGAILGAAGGITGAAGCLDNADVDDDGFVTLFDAFLVLKYWAGLITEFPANG